MRSLIALASQILLGRDSKMQSTAIEQRFLGAMQQSYQKVLDHGTRSNEKTKVLHGWVQEEMARELGNDYTFVGQTPMDSTEANVSGMYYDKDVDVLIIRNEHELGVISIKFVISNYWQNAINYFEQQIGETANLRRKNVVYGNLFCVTNPIPYKKRSGEISRLERIRERDIQRYGKLRADHEHAHAPDEMALGIVDLDIEQDVITRITDPSALDISKSSYAALANELSVVHFFTRMARRVELRYLSP